MVKTARGLEIVKDELLSADLVGAPRFDGLAEFDRMATSYRRRLD